MLQTYLAEGIQVHMEPQVLQLVNLFHRRWECLAMFSYSLWNSIHNWLGTDVGTERELVMHCFQHFIYY